MTSETNPHQSVPSEPGPTTPVADAFLTIGRIVGAHGLRGEVKLALVTDRPEKLHELRRVYLNGNPSANRIARLRLRGNDREAILKLHEVTDRDEAESLRGAIVQIRGNQLPPPESGSYFHYQILGLEAVDEAGQFIGRITEIIDAGEVDVYVVTDNDQRQHLFPALADVVIDISPAMGRVVIRPQTYFEESVESK